MGLAKRIQAKQTLFVHLEEYWNRSYEDYKELEERYTDIAFAYDGMGMTI